MKNNNIIIRILTVCLFFLSPLMGGSVAGEDTNLASDSILTYTAHGGTGLIAQEKISLAVSGNYSSGEQMRQSLHSDDQHQVVPAFWSRASAESLLLGVSDMAVQTSSAVTDTGFSAKTPATLHYSIHIDPISGSDSFAQGQVSVVFRGEILKAADSTSFDGIYYSGEEGVNTDSNPWNRNYWDEPARKTSYIERTTIAGGILALSKTFDYHSRISL